MLRIGDQAPDFRLERLADGSAFHLREAARAGSVMIAFFKESCPTCRMALPYLERALIRSTGSRARAVFILQDMPWPARALVEEFHLQTEVLLDEAPYAVSDSYELEFVPSAFLIDRGMVIRSSAESFQRDILASMVETLALENGKTPVPFWNPGDNLPAFRPG